MEHSDLVSEMCRVEDMSTQERLQLARRRRAQQLRAWAQREQSWSTPAVHRHRTPVIRFSDNVILLEAASRNDIPEVRRLLMKGVSSDTTNEDGLTALHQCCIDNNEEMMKLLLEFGANVNAEDSEKWTPLHAAATCGHLHLVKHLIANGANLLAVNADGNMPYDICEEEASLEYIEGEMARRGVTQQLIDETRATTEMTMLADLAEAAAAGEDLENPDSQKATPLHIAAANGYLRVVEFLLDNHVSTDVRDNDDWQPVHAAACWGHLEVLELLVQNGADLNAKTKHDETPADICEDPELRERIIELRTEQESKREAQRRRVRRTQSNNRRARSVRRTSIRDRGLPAKKDAAEEAKLRLQAQEIPDIGIKVSTGNSSLNMGPSSARKISKEDVGARREPEGKDSDTSIGSESKDSILAEATSYTTESNGKINIHVSVTINAGTLAELKKQRAQNRNSSPEGGATASDSDSTSNSNLAIVKKYSGDTGEHIIGDAKARRCCILS
ncbi:hypothetical protein AAG570_013762 [Ranatra chinensis]|uniref:Protein phosphatase 1 regulatory subunit 16A n=1 Tax=Ranatra chinensis TaxID=642074 RepID=A0ABD0YZE8_9HEMI